MSIVFQSEKFRDHIWKRSNHLHDRYLRLFFQCPRQEQIVEDFYCLVLMYIEDVVYQMRHVNVCKQLMCPGVLYVYMRLPENKWRVRCFPRLQVIRCLELLIDQEVIPFRITKLTLAAQRCRSIYVKVVRFEIDKLYVEQHLYDMWMGDNYNFATAIHMD